MKETVGVVAGWLAPTCMPDDGCHRVNTSKETKKEILLLHRSAAIEVIIETTLGYYAGVP